MADAHDLALALRAAYLALHRRTDAALARHGVTADQFVLLSALTRGRALNQRELARRTASDPNTVRAMLLLLERRGLVVRQPHPTDARARTVALTAKGRRVYKKLWAVGEPIRESLVSALEPGEREAFFQRLSRVAQTLGGTGEGAKGAGEVNGGTESHEGSVP